MRMHYSMFLVSFIILLLPGQRAVWTVLFEHHRESGAKFNLRITPLIRMGRLLGKLPCLSVYIVMILKEHPSKGPGAQGKFLKIGNEPVSSAGAKEKILQLHRESPSLTGQCHGSRATRLPRREVGLSRVTWAGCYGTSVPARAKDPRWGTLPAATTSSSACETGAAAAAPVGCCPEGLGEATGYCFARDFPLKHNLG